MSTGVKKVRAISFVGGLILSLYSSIAFSEGAGDALFGVAAIEAAMSPMVVAGIQSSSDLAQAEINAGVSTYTNALTAATEAYKTNANVNISMFNTLATMRIAAMNSQRDLMTTAMTTAYQMANNNQNYDLQRRKLESDNYFRAQDFQLKAMLAQAQTALAQAQSQAALANQGLSNNMMPVRDINGQPTSNSSGLLSAATRTPALTNLAQVASINPKIWPNSNNWMATGLIRKEASKLAQVFRGVGSLTARGSSRQDRLKGVDLTELNIERTKAARNSNLPLHQFARAIRTGDTHTGFPELGSRIRK